MQTPQPLPSKPYVTLIDGRSHAASHGGASNPIVALHARTTVVGQWPTEDEVREAYVAAGFPTVQLDRAYRRKARWHTLPEVALVRFPKPIGTMLQQSELMLNVAPGS